mmetsp:Transcript_13274/g.12022  ORF Transcript_13274/g.12022 Transcript_13274/m.12022 type:complete len:853 (+) Transcript_13274:7-2565(+)
MTSVNKPLFEAFFWIQPHRANPTSAYQSTKVLWHYPDDVGEVIKQFRDIPQFCFPDMEKVQLERADSCKSENFTFTLTDANKNLFYGVCLRQLFRGEKRRYDVSRRPRHCLCIITRQPYFSLFRLMLLQIHSLALLESQPGCARLYLDIIYQQSLVNVNNNSLNTIYRIAHNMLPELQFDLQLTTPRFSGLRISNREVSILPLLEVLGVERFLLLLSAVLCERRVLFIADDVDRLSSSVLAAASMLHPFSWQHIFIPLLPTRLLDFAAAPMPYLIGVRRYQYQKIKKEDIGDLLIVDADSGDCRIIGSMIITDFVGESASTLKQASESFDRVRAKASGMANMLLGKSSSESSDNYTGPRDIAATVVNDLKAILNSKPGSTSIQSVASGLLRNLPGGGKSLEELKVTWQVESEKTLRDSLIIFFVYIFASLNDFIITTNSNNKSNVYTFTKEDSRSAFNINAFKLKRQSMGDSKELLDFINEFIHSQMFERFCDDRITRSRNPIVHDDDDDLYESACSELLSRKLPHNVSNVKQVVNNRSSGGLEKVGNEFHIFTFQYTSGIYDNESIDKRKHIVDGICIDSYNNLHFLKILKTISMRLDGCKASGGRGNSGLAGVRAINLLKKLLLHGPDSILSYSLDFISIIKDIVHLVDRFSSQSAANAFEYISQGAVVETRLPALSILNLLIDHPKLIIQRRFVLLSRRGYYPFTTSRFFVDCRKNDILTNQLVNGMTSIKFTSFDNIHSLLKPRVNLPAFDKSKLKLGVVIKVDSNDIENDNDEDEIVQNTNNLTVNLLDVNLIDFNETNAVTISPFSNNNTNTTNKVNPLDLFDNINSNSNNVSSKSNDPFADLMFA